MSELQGSCAACGRGIPVGYLPVVTKWKTVEWGKTLRVSKPVEMFCRQCKSSATPTYTHHRRKYNLPERSLEPPSGIPEGTPQVSLREVAEKVWGVLSVSTPYGSKRLAKMTGLTDVDSVKKVLKKLLTARKVQFTEERKWKRV